MGTCLSSPSSFPKPSHQHHRPPSSATASKLLKQSQIIERSIKIANEQAQKQVYKLLLLGAGESGKSTILKQLRHLHDLPFSPSELVEQRGLMWENILCGFGLIFEGMEEWGIELEGGGGKETARNQIDQALRLLLLSPSSTNTTTPIQPFPPNLHEPLLELWLDEGVQSAWRRGKERCFPENLPYLMEERNMDRFWEEGFLPSSQDILRLRAKTVGVSETVFRIRGNTFNVIDVAGQRSERRKWIHCFEGVSGLVFVVSLAGYDTCLVEDETANQMQESLLLYSQIVSSPYFRNSYHILFLNKLDLFQTKILLLQSSIKSYFHDFNGAEGYGEAGSSFSRKKFLRLFRGRAAAGGGGEKSREIYAHETTAVDPKLMKFVMLATTGVILPSKLETSGLL